MDKELFHRYAPLVVIVFMFFMQYNLFVTPKEQEELHRVILTEIDTKYATKEKTNTMQSQMDRMNEKLDKVLYILTDGKK